MLTFFLLYITEGIPLGFSATAMATELRERGVGPMDISAFIAVAYLPWTWKWVIGPVVDNVYSHRLGRRRAWIVGAQILMVGALFYASSIPLSSEIGALMGIIVIVNIFGATQDVAIDALACATLAEHERGLANGLMFAGAYAGQAVGGAGALKLAAMLEGTMSEPFTATYFAVGAAILTITIFVALPMRESNRDSDAEETVPIGTQITTYGRETLVAFFGSPRAILALAFALAPCGGYALSLALQSILAVDLGLNKDQIATLALLSTLISAGACIAGGLLSDFIGRKLTITIFATLTALTTASLALVMWKAGWVDPLPSGDMRPDNYVAPKPPLFLARAFWILCLVFSLFHGLIYAVRIALLMDLCNPKIAATQFTAYMAMGSVIVIYTAAWQGWAMENWGFPTTLAIDACLGVGSLALLPFLKKYKAPDSRPMPPGAPVEPTSLV